MVPLLEPHLFHEVTIFHQYPLNVSRDGNIVYAVLTFPGPLPVD